MKSTDIEQFENHPRWIQFLGSEKVSPCRNGGMEQNFLVVLIFQNFRLTLQGTSIPKILEWNSRKCLFQSPPYLEHYLELAYMYVHVQSGRQSVFTNEDNEKVDHIITRHNQSMINDINW